MSEPSTPPVTLPARSRAAAALLWAYRLFPVALLPVLLFLSGDFGITWDEKTQQRDLPFATLATVAVCGRAPLNVPKR